MLGRQRMTMRSPDCTASKIKKESACSGRGIIPGEAVALPALSFAATEPSALAADKAQASMFLEHLCSKNPIGYGAAHKN